MPTHSFHFQGPTNTLCRAQRYHALSIDGYSSNCRYTRFCTARLKRLSHSHLIASQTTFIKVFLFCRSCPPQSWRRWSKNIKEYGPHTNITCLSQRSTPTHLSAGIFKADSKDNFPKHRIHTCAINPVSKHPHQQPPARLQQRKVRPSTKFSIPVRGKNQPAPPSSTRFPERITLTITRPIDQSFPKIRSPSMITHYHLTSMVQPPQKLNYSIFPKTLANQLSDAERLS